MKKFGILKITGGTPGLACAISAGKKMGLDQKPPLQREQVVGSSHVDGERNICITKTLTQIR